MGGCVTGHDPARAASTSQAEAFWAACEAGDAAAAALPRAAACAPANSRQNRYCDVLPFDANRVVLRTDDESSVGRGGDASSSGDYVNASWIRPRRAAAAGVPQAAVDALPDATTRAALQAALPSEYIACQGPLPHTTSAFWRMVYQTRSSAIVMVTGYVEGVTDKCAVYLPLEVGATEVHGNLAVRCVGVHEMALQGEGGNSGGGSVEEVIATEVQLEVAPAQQGAHGQGKALRVSQFHFRVWRDHDVPDERYLPALARFSRRVRSHAVAAGGPVVVHCSAGIGRTGTYIAMDAIIGEAIATGRLFELSGLVGWMRTQRVGMVKNAQQYRLVAKLLQSELQHLEAHRRVLLKGRAGPR